METVTVNKASKNLEKLLKLSKESHKPIRIKSDKLTSVILSEEDWNAVEETLYLLSIPKMRESIVKGLKTPIENCSKKIDW